ncbi:hypothetical protein ACIRVK_14525 [Streptomyces sp. NPDC101152]|uniref:hypothetical protein n=1 Tax=Streptomyces sp. NPDC101152 TaxID=3366116 RepID=UPI0037F4E792
MKSPKPPVGSHVVDTRTGKAGIVMGHEGPYVQLRPFGGGKEWDADPGAVREAPAVGENGSHESVPRRRHRAAHPEAG